MTVNYTTLLGLAEPVTGTQSGTWGDDVNKGITDYLDIAIAGTQIISGSQTAVTLSITNGSSAASNIAQVASGATGSAQYQIIRCTGGPAGLLTITAPASSKTYVIINATSTSQSVKIVAPGPTTGVTVVFGEKALVAWNGSDFTKVATSNGALGTVAIANGGTGQTTASAAFNALSPVTTTGDLILGNGTNSATRLAIGSNGFVLTSNGTTASWAASTGGVTSFSAGSTGFTPSTGTTGAVTLAGTLATTNGGTNLTSFTSGGALYATSTSALTTGTLPVASGGTGLLSALLRLSQLTAFFAKGKSCPQIPLPFIPSLVMSTQSQPITQVLLLAQRLTLRKTALVRYTKHLLQALMVLIFKRCASAQ
jgi:hypothetical protein